MRELIAFNKKGDKKGQLELQPLYYLETEKDWIQRHLDRTPDLDGIVLIIDWESKQIIPFRYAKDS